MCVLNNWGVVTGLTLWVKHFKDLAFNWIFAVYLEDWIQFIQCFQQTSLCAAYNKVSDLELLNANLFSFIQYNNLNSLTRMTRLQNGIFHTEVWVHCCIRITLLIEGTWQFTRHHNAVTLEKEWCKLHRGLVSVASQSVDFFCGHCRHGADKYPFLSCDKSL